MTFNANCFHIRLIVDNDIEELARLIAKVFSEREPLCSAVGVTDDEFYIYDGKPWAQRCANDGLSFVCVDRSLPIGNQIVGFRLCETLKPVNEIKVSENEKVDLETAFDYLLNDFKYAWFKEHPNFANTSNDTPKCLQFQALGIKHGYENLGIASKLVKHSINNAKIKGFEYIYVIASSSASQYIFEKKFKFKAIVSKAYKDIEYGGNYFFTNVTNPPHIIGFELDLSNWDLLSNAISNAF